jgi:GxGYxY sequence motif in domain of unknown function N-terminal/GxGYxYP putative glycoside hydrolase C-terminal domain
MMSGTQDQVFLTRATLGTYGRAGIQISIRRKRVMRLIPYLVLIVGGAVDVPQAYAASGLFPKMPAATNLYVVDCRDDNRDARMSARALQGLVNQSSAEVYITTKGGLSREQLALAGKPHTPLPSLAGTNAGVRTLFQKYQGRVKKMIVYTSGRDWTWCLSLMAAAQQEELPVTEPVRNLLATEFAWTGPVEDFRNRWTNRLEAYDWALSNLMPGCSKKVVFTANYGVGLFDYAAATKGFAFWLNLKDKAERAEAEKIFQAKGYGVGTSLMGYASSRDDANIVANKYAIGYVVGDGYFNGSFWSSFPNKTYRQPPGRAIEAKPGKVYVAFIWSDGDNLQFAQNGFYPLWKDPARGSVPVGTTLAPALQELNTPLLDWFYANMKGNDELVAGPCGVQFIYGRDFNASLFPAWCALNKEWIAGAGFRTGCMWVTQYPSQKYSTYLATCGLSGVFHNYNHIGLSLDTGVPVMNEGVTSGFGVAKEEQIVEKLAKVMPSATAPVFRCCKCLLPSLGTDGYGKIKRQVEKLEAAYPGRYVFLLPKDLFATIRKYYHLPIASGHEIRPKAVVTMNP